MCVCVSVYIHIYNMCVLFLNVKILVENELFVTFFVYQEISKLGRLFRFKKTNLIKKSSINTDRYCNEELF